MIYNIITLLCTAIIGISNPIIGNVTDTNGTPLPGVMVSIKGEKGNILAYTMTDADGNFNIQTEKAQIGGLLEISSLGYSKETFTYPFPDKIEICLKESNLEIDEAIIKAEKVVLQGDTTIFYAQGLITTSDRNLSDVLKRLPGIDVSKDGFVKYHGKNIASLKIEGSDLLGNKYNLATQNIKPEDLKAIELYENHQNIKALEGIQHSDDIVLNIKLNEGSKNRWAGALQIEGGYAQQKPHIPYGANVLGMNIGKNLQTLTTLKTDAAGNNISVKSSENPLNYNLRNYFSIDAPKAPLSEKRSRFNTSYSASNNTKTTLGEDCNLGVSASYNNNVLDSKSITEKIYNYDNDSLVSFIEDRNVKLFSQDAVGDIVIEKNSKKIFVYNKLQFLWKTTSAMDSLSASQNKIEKAKNESYDIVNDINSIIRIKEYGSINLSMNTQLTSKKGYYLVDNDVIHQDINSSVFINNVSIAYTHSFNSRWSIGISPGLDYVNRVLISDLTSPLSEENFKSYNNLRMEKITPKALITIDYSDKKVETKLISYIGYNNYSFSDISLQTGSFYTTTYLSTQIKLTKRLFMNFLGIYTLQPTNEQNIYNGIIMNNYKYLSIGSDNITTSPTFNLDASIIYKDPLSGWGVSFGGNYTIGRSTLSSRYFVDDFIISEYSDDIAEFSQWDLGSKIEKSFYDIGSKLSFSIKYNEQYSSLNQNGTPYNYRNNTLTPKLEFNGNITRWLNIIYKGQYVYNKYNIEGSYETTQNNTLSQEIKLAFYPHKKLEINISAEHYYNKNNAGTKQQMILADCSIWYYATKKLQFFLHAKNLLNEDKYCFTNISPLQTSHYIYNIRPLNILIGLEYRF